MTLESYVGIPFVEHGRTAEGVDCWGLIRLFFRNEVGTVLPNLLDYKTTRDRATISQIIDREKSDWRRIKKPDAGDVIVFKIAGQPTHVGLYIGQGRFIHAYKGTHSCVEALESPQWKQRIEGYYRYE